jgi:hypothetical protein
MFANSNGEERLAALHRVCKTIHCESALLPFSLNTCHFQNLGVILSMKKYLMNSQRATIKSVDVWDAVSNFPTASLWVQKCIKTHSLRKILGLPQLLTFRLRIYVCEKETKCLQDQYDRDRYYQFFKEITAAVQGEGTGEVNVILPSIGTRPGDTSIGEPPLVYELFDN